MKKKFQYGKGKAGARLSRRTILAAVISSLGLSQSVQAQADDSSTLETVVVIGQPLNKVFEVNAGGFGAKDSLDIPLAIQSISAKVIADSSARTAVDILSFDSSILSASPGGSFDNYRLRGFAMDSFNTVRRDGLALAPHHDFALENIERIDVLKGPSGFLYGFNSPGGTINYLLKRPTQDPLLTVKLQGTSLAGKYAAIDTSASTDDGLFGYRVNAGYEKNGDFDHARDMERKFAGISTDMRLSDSALLQINGDWSWKSSVADPLLRADQAGRADALDPSSFVLPPEVNRRDLLTGSWYRHTTEGSNLDAKLELSLNDNWVSITQANYSRVVRHGGYNDLFAIQPNGDIGYADYYASRGEVFSTASMQSYFAGKFATGGLQHDVFMGLSAREFKDKSPFWDFVESANGISVNRVSVGNILNPVQPPEWDFGPKQAHDFTSNITENSLFASDLVSINSQFQVLLGGRYIWYRAKHLSATSPSQEKNVFVPTGAFIFRPTENSMTYASFSKGFEKGEYAPFYANNANQPTDAIESEQRELGLKVELNTSTNVGMAIFDIRRNASYTNLDNDFVTSGEYTHSGIELSIDGKVSQNLTLTANTAYLSTELNDVTDTSTLGKRSEGVPEWQGAVRGRYLIRQWAGLSLDGGVSYIGSRPVDAQNSGFIPSYTLVDAGISYETKIGDTAVTYRLHGKNLTNEYYYSSTYYLAGLEVGRTREVFLSADFKF